MDSTQIYIAIRSEIIANHALMHWFTFAVALVLLVGVAAVERLGKTILSILLPLLALGWAASVWRFDFFIHRQAAYLRTLEASMTQTNSQLMWETWKGSRHAAAFAIPIADILATAVIVVATFYLLFGPAQQYLTRWGRVFAIAISVSLILVLLSLTIVPKVASY